VNELSRDLVVAAVAAILGFALGWFGNRLEHRRRDRGVIAQVRGLLDTLAAESANIRAHRTTLSAERLRALDALFVTAFSFDTSVALEAARRDVSAFYASMVRLRTSCESLKSVHAEGVVLQAHLQRGDFYQTGDDKIAALNARVDRDLSDLDAAIVDARRAIEQHN
jgi:hypothetical protein